MIQDSGKSKIPKLRFEILNVLYRDGQPAAQIEISVTQTRIENLRILGVFPQFLL
jgi:hypothetical protein